MLKSAIANYANAIKDTYATPIALDRLEPLVCMTVGAGRIKLVNDLYNRICVSTGCADAGKPPTFGMRMEAVTGEFGSGKSHIGYMLKQNLLSVDEEILLAHVQITGAAQFQASISGILRALQLSGQPSFCVNGVELSAYRQLFQWYGGSQQQVFSAVQNLLGNLPERAGRDFAHGILNVSDADASAAALQQFFDAWVTTAETPRQAIEVLLFVLRLFVGVSVCRLVLIVDEFEAIQHLPPEERRGILQSFQDLHDSLSKQDAGSLSSYLVLFATDDWIKQVDMMLPSFGSRNRLRRVTPIPDLGVMDIRALVYKSLYFYMMGDAAARLPTEEQMEAVCQKVIANSGGKRYHLRSIQRDIHDELEMLMSGAFYESAPAPQRKDQP